MASLLSATAAAAANQTGCIGIEGDEILAGDAAKAWDVFKGVAPDTPVAPAPAPPSRRLFTGLELRNLARKLQIKTDLGGTSQAPLKVCFERRMESLARERVLEALRSALDQDGFDRETIHLELVDYTRETVPRGALDFQPQGLSRPPVGAPATPVIWRGRVRYGNARSYPIWARVRLLVKQSRLVAKSAIAAGKGIKPTDVQPAILDVFPYPRTVDVPSVEQAAGHMSRRMIRAGEVINPSMLGVARDVERGDVVTVEVRSGATKLRFEAKADSGGRAGDMVVVRNPTTGRRFQGRISERGVVQVDVATVREDVIAQEETNAENH
jgi:flagella basal body P-ring formation protein FlgA